MAKKIFKKFFMLISYIIPVYNVGQYLHQCVDSLLCQTYKNIEVILVDDGSYDNSGTICDEYVRREERVKVIHKSNGGLSDARNVGLDAAQGEYIIFVDSDDFWSDADALQRLMNETEKANWPDMVSFNIMYYFPSNNKYEKWISYGPDMTEATDVNNIICALTRTGTMPMSACCKMLRRSTLQYANLRFIKGLTGEDTPWFIDLMQIIKTIKFVNDYIYCYRCRVAGSITNTFNEKRYLQYIDTTEKLIPTIQNSKVYSQAAKDSLLSFVAYQFCIAISQLNRINPEIQGEICKRIKKHMWLFRYTENPKVRLVAKVYNIGGFRCAELLLRLYMKCRKNQ